MLNDVDILHLYVLEDDLHAFYKDFCGDNAHRRRKIIKGERPRGAEGISPLGGPRHAPPENFEF